VPIWTYSDLNDPATNPAEHFAGARVPLAVLNEAPWTATEFFMAPDDRDDPFLIAHPPDYGVLAWTDHRRYTDDPLHGRIELYVATVDDALAAGTPVVFGHARFFAGLSDLNATTAGSNVILVWADNRHSMGITDPRPEVYLDTAWY
jgi:hypothetical protein